MQHGVYLVGPLVHPRAREMAAALACGAGAVVSHRSAAVLWQLWPDREGAPIDVTVPLRHRGRRPGLHTHRVRTLPNDEVTKLDAIPITTPARTILDLAAVAPSREVEQAVAQAIRERLNTHAETLGLLERYPRRPGGPLLRALLNSDAAPALTRSEAEDRLLALIRRARLPNPDVNAMLGAHEVDFLWRAQGLVVEVDGFDFHSSRARFESDRRRDADVSALGCRVVRLTWRQITREPEATLVRLAQALTATAPITVVGEDIGIDRAAQPGRSGVPPRSGPRPRSGRRLRCGRADSG